MNGNQPVIQPPSPTFTVPDDIFYEPSFTRGQKIRLLRDWEYDARELQVAEEENMSGGPADMLDQILTVLHQLDAKVDLEHSPPTKQG